MIKGTLPGRALEPLRTLFGAGTTAGLTDGQLLERFAGRCGHDAEAAFAALVSRHGPMVRRVCRSLLADANDADDAFQATFLVLARKAGAIRRPELLANWLYGTAHRAARTLKTRAARRLKHETREAVMAHTRVSSIQMILHNRQRAVKRPGSSMRSWPGCRELAGWPWCSASWKRVPSMRSPSFCAVRIGPFAGGWIERANCCGCGWLAGDWRPRPG